MKTKTMLSVLAGLVMSASAMASTPASYDTKFNVSANVPDSATIPIQVVVLLLIWT